jgi:hypothetical protein
MIYIVYTKYHCGVQIRCVGHTACMGEIRNTYKLLVGNAEGKRSLGRPGHR